MIKKFKIGKWYLYVSDVRLRAHSRHGLVRQSNHKKFRLLREALHKERSGLCEECGKFVGIMECELHHIIPLSDNPSLYLSKRNLRLLCRDCHKKEHSVVPNADALPD